NTNHGLRRIEAHPRAGAQRRGPGQRRQAYTPTGLFLTRKAAYSYNLKRLGTGRSRRQRLFAASSGARIPRPELGIADPHPRKSSRLSRREERPQFYRKSERITELSKPIIFVRTSTSPSNQTSRSNSSVNVSAIL